MTSILLIRPSALGDVCRTVPVLVSLRRAFPDARIDWVVRDIFIDAVAAHPGLTTAIPMPRSEFGRQLRRLHFGPLRRWTRSLAATGYDLAIDCQGLFRSGFFCWASRARRRIGYSNARELGWMWLNERYHIPAGGHAVDRMLDLVRLAGIEPVRDMRLYTTPAERDRLSRDAGLSGKRFAVVAPSSAWAGKQWPADRFAAVIRWMLESSDGPRLDAVVLVGTDKERGTIAPVLDLARTNARVLDRVGATSVGGLMALVEASTLVLGNDSAPIHMAVGFDTPAVALFGATRIHENGPYTGHNPASPVIVIQHPAPERINHRRSAGDAAALMRQITIDEVQRSIMSLAGDWSAIRSSSQSPA